MTAAQRQAVYTAASALIPVFVAFGLITQDQADELLANAGVVIGAIGALVGFIVPLIARKHTPGKHTDNGDGIPDNAGIEVVPASEATSDTKSDAAL